MEAGFSFDAYVIGALRSEASERRAELESAMTQQQWQAATGVCMQRAIRTGRYPDIGRVMRDATRSTAEFAAGVEVATRHAGLERQATRPLDGQADERDRGVVAGHQGNVLAFAPSETA